MSNQTSPHADSLWFYADAHNQPVGPLPFRTIQTLATAGVIQPGTQVVESGRADWRVFAEITTRPLSPPPSPHSAPLAGQPAQKTVQSNDGTMSPQSKHGKLDDKIARAVGAVFLILIIGVFALVKCSNSESTPKTGGKTSDELVKSDLIITDIENAPLEYRIVFLDSGHFPRGNDVGAARIRYLLKSISEKTGDSSKTIADTASRASQLLKKDYGKNVTIQAFLEQANRAFESGTPKASITEVAPILVQLMSR